MDPPPTCAGEAGVPLGLRDRRELSLAVDLARTLPEPGVVHTRLADCCSMTAEALQLLLPEGLSASAVADTLAAELPIVSRRRTTIERVFWDTFDGRLHGAGLALVAAAGRLSLADARTYAEQAGELHGRGPARLLATDLPAGALRERLAAADRDARGHAGRARAQPPAAAQRARRRRQDRRAPARRGADGARRRRAGRAAPAAARPSACSATTASSSGCARCWRARSGSSTRRARSRTTPSRRQAAAPAGSRRSCAWRSIPRSAPTSRPSRSCGGCWRSSSSTCPARWRTSTASSCTTCAWPCAARERCSASCAGCSRPSRCASFATASRSCSASPARRAISTCSCWSSTSSRRGCRPASPATSRRCAGCSRTTSWSSAG